MTGPDLILASESPRRRELLAEAGYHFRVLAPAPEAEDGVRPGEAPADLVLRLARQKAESVARRVAAGIVVGCDTVAVCQGAILGKPRDRAEAEAMLRRLRGTVHEVYSGLCLWYRPSDHHDCRLSRTTLEMDVLTEEQLQEYLASELWVGKAGAFGYQDRQGWLRVVAGSESNVVGLPLELLAEMLANGRG